MNTQTQEAGYLFDFSKFLFDEHGLIVTDTEMQEIIHEAKKVATQPIAADAEAVLKKHLECSPSKIIQHSYLPAVIAAMKEYASQPKGAGVPKEFIICAANWYNDKKKHERQPKNIIEGFTVCGRRHHNCIGTFAQIVGFPYTQAGHEIHETEIQGFLTNTNRFVSRKEAFEIARDANQIQGPNKGQQENSIGLTSEDLY